MWSPTHINITVHRARNLLCKGKAGTNDCYATMQLGKDKYHTSIKEKSKDPEWQEECDFPLSEQKSVLKIGIYHRNLLGIDEFLGQISIPLDQFPLYERPRSRWYELKGKPGSTKPEKNRGEVELTIAFMVHSLSGSYVGLNKSEKSTKSLSIKSLAHTVGDKLSMKWPSKSSLSVKSGSRSDVSSGAFSTQSMLDLRFFSRNLTPDGTKVSKCLHVGTSNHYNVSPARVRFVETTGISASQKSLADSNSPTEASKTLGSCKDQMSSLASLVELSEDAPDSVFPLEDSLLSSAVPSPEYASPNEKSNEGGKGIGLGDEGTTDVTDTDMKTRKKMSDSPKTASAEKFNEKFKRFKEGGSTVKCHTLGHPGRSMPQVSAYEMLEMEEYKRTRREMQKTRNILNSETIDRFSSYEREELVKLIVDQKSEISKKDAYIRDLEDYIDNLLVKVIETQPKLLQNPYESPSVHSTSSAKRLAVSSSSHPVVPPSSTMPPGIYVSATWGENAPQKNPVTMTAASSNKKLNASKNVKRQLIISSPLKKLQALIK